MGFPELKELEEENKKLKERLNAKLVFINNGWEEEQYALQEENTKLREVIVNDSHISKILKNALEGELK